MSTSLDGLGATLPPPMTYICPLKLSALVSPVALGIGCDRANCVGDRIEAERVGGVHHCATLEIRRTSHVDGAAYGARGRIHDPFRRVHLLCPPGACRSIGVKLPYLVGGSHVDVEPAQDVQLVVSHRKPTRQNRAGGITRPVVAAKEGRGISDWIVGEHASCGCGRSGCRSADAIDQRSAGDGEHATSHVIHLIVGQCRCHLGPTVGRGVELEHVLEVRACHIRGAATYCIKVAIRLEINANCSDQYRRQVRTG